MILHRLQHSNNGTTLGYLVERAFGVCETLHAAYEARTDLHPVVPLLAERERRTMEILRPLALVKQPWSEIWSPISPMDFSLMVPFHEGTTALLEHARRVDDKLHRQFEALNSRTVARGADELREAIESICAYRGRLLSSVSVRDYTS